MSIISPFWRLFPNIHGLTVVIPRRHLSSDILSLEIEEFEAIVIAAYTVSGILQTALDVERAGMFMEGFEIDHAHVKLLPVSMEQGVMSIDASGYSINIIKAISQLSWENSCSLKMKVENNESIVNVHINYNCHQHMVGFSCVSIKCVRDLSISMKWVKDHLQAANKTLLQTDALSCY